MNKKSGYIEAFLYISTEYRALLYCIKKYDLLFCETTQRHICHDNLKGI